MLQLPSGGALHSVNESAMTAPILFLHGLGGAAWSWAPQAEALAPEHPCFVWEGRGHGEAAPVEDAGFADYLCDAREALGVVMERTKRPAIVAGHSAGGFLAMMLACEVAVAVESLFLVEAFWGRLYPSDAVAALCAPVVRPGTRMIVASHRRGGRLATTIFHRSFATGFDHHGAMERAWEAQRLQLPFDYPRMFLDVLEGPNHLSRHDFANELGLPVYLLDGTSGRKRPARRAFVETLRSRLGDACSYETVPGGHYLQLDQPEAVTQRLTRFARAAAQRA